MVKALPNQLSSGAGRILKVFPEFDVQLGGGMDEFFLQAWDTLRDR